MITALIAAGMTVKAGCLLLGVARSNYYRIDRGYRHYVPAAAPIPHKDRLQPAALTAPERAGILTALESDEYADLSVVQSYWCAFDAGTVECSERTFYRVAGHHAMVGDRRRSKSGATAQRRAKPIVHAGAVGELWSWDVTELHGPRTQDRYKLYLAIDVFSRYPVGWRIEYTEKAVLAVEMFARAIAEHTAPTAVHADNGSMMRAHQLVDSLVDEGIVPSYSRPRVSDDNPFSESLFKTIKYDLDCPLRFDDIEHARTWTAQFLHRYATEHRHSGLGRYTPHDVHHGTAVDVQTQRQLHLDQAYLNHPERFRNHPTAPALPSPTGINTNLSHTG